MSTSPSPLSALAEQLSHLSTSTGDQKAQLEAALRQALLTLETPASASPSENATDLSASLTAALSPETLKQLLFNVEEFSEVGIRRRLLPSLIRKCLEHDQERQAWARLRERLSDPEVLARGFAQSKRAMRRVGE